MYAWAPNGLPIIGTLEKIEGRAEITPESFIREEPSGRLEFEYCGRTEMFWDGQVTAQRDCSAIFLDEEGNEWLEKDITLTEEDQAPDAPPTAEESLRNLLKTLRELGFGTDDEISGADTVDAINFHFPKLVRAVQGSKP